MKKSKKRVVSAGRRIGKSTQLKSVKDTAPLNFGKYKGRTPTDIAKSDPAYIVWMWEAFRDPPCTHDLVLDCESAIQDRDGDDPTVLDDWAGEIAND